MGFLDFLFGSKKRTNVEVVPDHIWMTTDAKLVGVLEVIAAGKFHVGIHQLDDRNVV